MTKVIQAITAIILLLTNQMIVPIEEEDYYQMIPDEAIRLRILAESDDPNAQELKIAVRDNVNQEITKWVEDLTDIDQARELIQDQLDQIEEIVAETVEAHVPGLDFSVDYDEKINFPAKLYDQYVYPAGEYEAILITLGEGKGANWWCVLFPPLCFLDFSAGSTVTADGGDEAQDVVEEHDQSEDEDDADEPKISFFLFEWFNWF